MPNSIGLTYSALITMQAQRQKLSLMSFSMEFMTSCSKNARWTVSLWPHLQTTVLTASSSSTLTGSKTSKTCFDHPSSYDLNYYFLQIRQMPKGRSYSSDNWQQFQRGSQTFIHDDFAHEKAFVFKSKLENSNSGVNIKQTINERPEGLNQAGQVKLWFSLQEERTLFAKVGTDTKVKIQADNGVRELKQIKNNFYLGGEVSRTLTQKLAYAGIELFEGNKWSANTKVSHDFSKNSTFIHNKLHLHWNGWKLNEFSTFDITNRILTKCGVLLGWTPKSINNWNYSLFFQNSKKPEKVGLCSLFLNPALSITNRWSETQTVGIYAHFNVLGLKNIFSEGFNVFNSIWLGSQWKLSQSTVKARISKDLTTSITVKNKLGNYGNYSLGIEATEIGSKNRFKFGVQLDLNL